MLSILLYNIFVAIESTERQNTVTVKTLYRSYRICSRSAKDYMA